MHRCIATMKAVYRQHQDAAREFRTGLPASFDIMIRPGVSVNYLKQYQLYHDGAPTGIVEYVPDTANGWHSFSILQMNPKEQIEKYIEPIARGEYSFFESVLNDGTPNPYRLR